MNAERFAAITASATACVGLSSWAYICRIARVCRAGPSVWSLQFRGVPLMMNDARSK